MATSILGVSIVGGLLISQFLTLYTTPVIYLYLDRLGTWARRTRRAGRQERELDPGLKPNPTLP